MNWRDVTDLARKLVLTTDCGWDRFPTVREAHDRTSNCITLLIDQVTENR